MGLLPELQASDVIFLHCPVCAFQTHFLSRLGEHFEQSHAGCAEFRLYRCPVCHLVTSSLTFMREHLSVRHETESPGADDIAVYFTGKLFSPHPQPQEPAAAGTTPAPEPDGERRCVFCRLRASDEELAEHYGAVHGVANVFFDRVCDEPAGGVVLEDKMDSADEIMESDDPEAVDCLPMVKSECPLPPDDPSSPALPPISKMEPLGALSFTSAQLSAAYHLAHSAALGSGAAASFASALPPLPGPALTSVAKPGPKNDCPGPSPAAATPAGLGSGSSGSEAPRTPDPSLTIPSPSTLVDSFSAVMNPTNRMIPRVTLSERAKNVLFQWLLTHLNEPYPSEEDKARLATMAAVNRTTVSNWFINARRRYIRPMKEGRLPPNNDFVRRVQRYTSFIQQQQRSLSSTAPNVKGD